MQGNLLCKATVPLLVIKLVKKGCKLEQKYLLQNDKNVVFA